MAAVKKTGKKGAKLDLKIAWVSILCCVSMATNEFNCRDYVFFKRTFMRSCQIVSTTSSEEENIVNGIWWWISQRYVLCSVTASRVLEFEKIGCFRIALSESCSWPMGPFMPFIPLAYSSQRDIYKSLLLIWKIHLYILVIRTGVSIHFGHSSQRVIYTSWSLISGGHLYILVTHLRRLFIHLGHSYQKVIYTPWSPVSRRSFIHFGHSSQRVIYTSLSLISKGDLYIFGVTYSTGLLIRISFVQTIWAYNRS